MRFIDYGSVDLRRKRVKPTFTDAQRYEAANRVNNGESVVEVAKALGVAYTTVGTWAWRVANGMHPSTGRYL